ncbi:MAG: phenylalanine--tRNA ligase subunit alpha [Rhodothermales bacterium]
MSDPFQELEEEVRSAVLDSDDAVEAFRIRFLSKKQGRITDLMKAIPTVAPEDRKSYGARINALKSAIEERINTAKTSLSNNGASLPEVDVSLPGRRSAYGSLHPITQTRNEIVRIFQRVGFSVEEGPEIEDEWHNFTALNFPADHPARDMQDTLFVNPSDDGDTGVLLRTHTSPVQIRSLLKQDPPIRIVVPGRVYRNESISYKSYCLFHQVEGLYVDKGVTFGDLKYVLHMFAKTIFGEQVQMRFRPSFFPFTEPSAEVDIWWADDSLPGGGRWMEILGCGMVDPNVLEAVNVDPEMYSGYAFGMGIERIAMLRYGIDDIRLLYENDIRFLKQF